MLYPYTLPNDETIVIKIGTDALAGHGYLGNLWTTVSLVRQASRLRKNGNNVVIVTSGAVGHGARALGWKDIKNRSSSDKAVAASVGQHILMGQYRRVAQLFGIKVGQLLPTNDNYTDEQGGPRFNLEDFFQKSFAVPNLIVIVNENDPISRAELKLRNENDPNSFSDNDGHASLLARFLKATRLISVSTNCVHTKDPRDPTSKPVAYINLACPKMNVAGQNIQIGEASTGGTGNMDGKMNANGYFLKAAREVGRMVKAQIISRKEMLNNGILKAARDEPVGTEIVYCPQSALCMSATNEQHPPRCLHA